jgi:hypothetical protein
MGARPARRRASAGWLRWPVGLVVWSAFGFAWWLVIHRNAQVGSPVLVGLGAAAILVLLITLLWVRRNRRIYRVKGPRRRVAVTTGPPLADRLGRQLVIEPGTGPASEVVLRVTKDGRKTYEPAGVDL